MQSMSAVTIVWTTCAAACLTIALVQVAVWLKHRDAREYLIFAILATAIAGIAACEMAMMYASTGEQIARAVRWLHVPIFVAIASIVALIRVYFRTGRAWLGHAAWGVRLVSLILNFAISPNLNYRTITGVRDVPFLGEMVAMPVGEPSLWTAVGQLSAFLLVGFVIDAAVGLWRRGGPDAHRRALLMGGAISLFLLVAAGSAILVLTGLTETPLTVTLGFLPMAAVMGYELSLDTLRAAQLARDLQATERTARELSGRLITAQEEERRRLARDLHDDLSQRFALLVVEMDLIGRLEGDGEVKTRTGRMTALLRELSSDVHAISHQLHPAKLDQLGFEAAARSWCRDVAAQSGLEVEFTSDRVATVLPQDVALCLYRVLQESLSNVVRHSGARTARVELRGDTGQVTLVVRDSGRGFDQVRRPHTSGIGLLSMQERVRLVDGVMAVRSRLAEGTRIEVTIPLTVKEA